MNFIKGTFLFLLIVIASFQTRSIYAGIYSDELTKCIVESSSTEDVETFARWMFATISLHPAVEPLASVTNKQRDEANKQCADLFTRLISVSCVEQAKKALKYEGQAGFESSFNVLGQMAMRELLMNPKVNAGMSDFEKHFDREKLESAINPK